MISPREVVQFVNPESARPRLFRMPFLAHASIWGWAIFALASLAASGCSSNQETGLYPVHGEVFLDGAPADGAWVHFHPVNQDDGTPAFAQVQSDGSYQLTTNETHDGAEEGEYIVTLIWRDEEKDDGETIYGPDRFKDRYNKPSISTLRAKIEPKKNDIKRFDIKSPAPTGD
jgi:hypothetical protein